MPIETICQSCARKLRVPDEHAGKKARCPQCGMIYVVPGTAIPTQPAPTAPDPVPTRSPHADHERWQMRTRDGRVYGPVPRQELDQWYAEGRVPAEASLLREGDSQWRSAAEVYPQLSRGGRNLNEQHNPFSETATPSRPARPRYQVPHRGGLILTLAIIGWAVCPVLGPFAWAMGNGDLRAMRAGRMDPTGQSLTQAGMVLGMIQTILVGLALALMCFGSFT